MSHNEANLLAFIVFAVLVILMYNDEPRTAWFVIIGMFAYMILAGHLTGVVHG